MKHRTIFFLLSFCLLITGPGRGACEEWPPDVDNGILARIYSGHEHLHFSISWSGGVKIGDLVLDVDQEPGGGFVIRARVTDYGLFRLFYPVDDTFVTRVAGPLKLPQRYQVEQVEGHGGSRTRRLSVYDQERGVVVYRKNDQPEQRFSLSGPAYNEFSSFFLTRALSFAGPGEPLVPTFADGRRHPVRVALLAREEKKTRFGRLATLKVMPRMEFKGLYDKDGDTVFWLSDDRCRVPLEISSRILIGSLVAELVEYENPACPEWTDRARR